MLRTLKKIQPQPLPIQSKSVQNLAQYSLHQDVEQSREQYQNSQRSQLDDIPELEDKDWKDGQFTDADLIDHHNTMTEITISENESIGLEKSSHFGYST